MKAKRIVNIITRLNVGGPSRYVAWLAAELSRAGYDSTLIAGTITTNEDDMSYLATSQGIEPLIIKEMGRSVSLKDIAVIWKLYRLFLQLRPDVVHTHTAKAGAVGRVAGLLYRWLTLTTFLGRPRPCLLVHTYHGNVLRSYFSPFKSRLFLTIEKLLARVATNRIVVISPQQYRELHHEFRIGRAKQYAVVPISIDTDLFAYQYENRHAVRRLVDVNDNILLLGVIGRLTEIKNHRLLLEAIALYKRDYKDHSDASLHLLVLGDGGLRRTLEEKAQMLGIEQEVSFLGTRHNLETFYSALDIIASTSLNEGTPLAVIEGMSTGRPIIATAVGGISDLLGHVIRPRYANQYDVCERGILVHQPDATAFCCGLVRLINDKGLSTQMGVRGRAFVEGNHSKDRFKDLIAIYCDGATFNSTMTWRDIGALDE
jgi:glycosyltransferase involved in cell wall biosynthesis